MNQGHVLGALHGLLLIWLMWRTSGHLLADVPQRICASFVLVWGNIAYTSLILSVFSDLNVRGLYFALSLGLAVSVTWFSSRRTLTPWLPSGEPEAPKERRLDKGVRYALAVTIVLAALATAAICTRYIPNNWDTVTYRMSRGFFYLAQGNLLHAGKGTDPRLYFYPFNGALLYLFLAVYAAPALCFNLISFSAWVVAGIAVYCAARQLGASKRGGFVAAWICLLSPAVLAQGASGNDEVLSSVPLLIAVIFGLEWFRTRRWRHSVLAGIAGGLALGAKLHWTFYVGFVAAAAFVIAYRSWRNRDLLRQLISVIPRTIPAIALALPLATGFIVANYISSGHITDEHFNNIVLNKPFSLALAREKLITTSAEMLISPVPDLVPPVQSDWRYHLNQSVNEWFMKRFSRFVPISRRLSPEGYTFRGPMDSYIPAETTVWLGFVPHLILLFCVLRVLNFRLPVASMILFGAAICWTVTYTMEMKYVFWSCTYFAFPAVLVAAAFGPAWDHARRCPRGIGRLATIGFVGLFVTQGLLVFNLLTFGMLRNVGFLFHKPAPPFDLHSAEESVVRTLQSARQIYIPGTHWEVLYFNFMRFNPVAKYSTGHEFLDPSPQTLMLLSVAARISDGLIPIPLPHQTPGALTYIGEADNEHVFTAGAGVESRWPSRSGYALVQIAWRRSPTSGTIVAVQNLTCCTGLTPGDRIVVRYAVQSKDTGSVSESPWVLPGNTEGSMPESRDAPSGILWLESRSLDDPNKVVRVSYDLGQAAYTVPAQPSRPR